MLSTTLTKLIITALPLSSSYGVFSKKYYMLVQKRNLNFQTMNLHVKCSMTTKELNQKSISYLEKPQIIQTTIDLFTRAKE